VSSLNPDSKYDVLKYYSLVLIVVTMIGYSVLTVNYSYAQELSPSISPSNNNIGNNSSSNDNGNNNSQQAINQERTEQVQKNQQSTIPDQQKQQVLPSVKITSHTQNQDVPTGTLTINGISSDTPSDSCTVYIILNNIKPYQKVIPIGKENGQSIHNDFSIWNYTFTPQYATIQEGTNKMTSKVSCDTPTTDLSNTDNNSTKFNSLNVTGIKINSSNSSNSNNSPLIKPLTNTTSSDSLISGPHTSNTSQNVIYSPLTPAPTTTNPLSTNDVEDEDNEIQSLNEQQGEEIDIDEANKDDDDTNDESSRAGEVFELVEKRLRDSGIDFDISSMLD
jgi:hypothetical protein